MSGAGRRGGAGGPGPGLGVGLGRVSRTRRLRRRGWRGPCFRATRGPSARTLCGDPITVSGPGRTQVQGGVFHRPSAVGASDGRWPSRMDLDVTDPLGRLVHVAASARRWSSASGHQGCATSLPGGRNRANRDPSPTAAPGSGHQRAAPLLVPPCPRSAGPRRLDGAPSPLQSTAAGAPGPRGQPARSPAPEASGSGRAPATAPGRSTAARPAWGPPASSRCAAGGAAP